MLCALLELAACRWLHVHNPAHLRKLLQLLVGCQALEWVRAADASLLLLGSCRGIPQCDLMHVRAQRYCARIRLWVRLSMGSARSPTECPGKRRGPHILVDDPEGLLFVLGKSGTRPYLQCLLNLQSLSDRGLQRLPIHQVQNYYRCLSQKRASLRQWACLLVMASCTEHETAKGPWPGAPFTH